MAENGKQEVISMTELVAPFDIIRTVLVYLSPLIGAIGIGGMVCILLVLHFISNDRTW